MRRRFLLPALATVFAACSRSDGNGAQLSLERSAPKPAHLADMPARLIYCSLDSTLTVVTEGGPWSTAISMRTILPPQRHFLVTSPPAMFGNAVVGVRSVSDSVRPALISSAGSVDLVPGATYSGSFEMQTSADTAATKLKGTFKGLTPDSSGCVS